MASKPDFLEGDDAASEDLRRLWTRCRELEAALDHIERRNRLLGDSAPFGIFTVDHEGRINGLNSKMRHILGWPEAIANRPHASALELAMFVEAGISDDLRLCLKTGRASLTAHPCINPHEECLQLRFHMSPVVTADHQVEGAIVFVEDFSLIQQAAEAVRKSDHRYHVLFHSAPVAMIERDASRLKRHLEDLGARGVDDLSAYFDQHPEEIMNCMSMIKTIDFNRAFMQLLDAENRRELSFARPWGDPDEFRELARDVILTVAGGEIGEERERVITSLKGRRKTVLTKGLAVSGHEATLSRLIITMIDISKRKVTEEALRESERRFREMALRDTLTGLYNRRYLYQSLPDLIASGRFDRTGLALIFMDLDNFKTIVDTHGHLHGSQVIKEVATTIQQALPPPAFAVAYAGDEFVAVLPGRNLVQAEAQAVDIQERIRQAVYLQTQGLEVRLTASLGLAAYPDQANDAGELLAFADNALFAMKARGKDGVRVHR